MVGNNGGPSAELSVAIQRRAIEWLVCESVT
jgi:hypothetical protein